MIKTLHRAFMSIRIPVQRWQTEAAFTEILHMLDEHPGVADDLALFTASTHPPLPLDVARERAALMARRIKQIKVRGYGCGINILATIGHHNENLSGSLQGDYTRRTDINGSVCEGSFCPNDPRFIKEYVIPLYTVMAQAGPDFIWIDDDVRTGHMPIGPDCFCDRCLEQFARISGILYTRETLDNDYKDKASIGKLWLQGKRDTFNRLFETIEKTVHGINPDIRLGFMTGERYADGYDFDTQASILSGPAGQEVLWRPGGGFYTDETLRGMTEKSHQIGRQVSLLPPWVRSIQSEIENFNYEALGKSVHITTTEVASHIAAGCTGAAFNIMGDNEPLAVEKRKLFKAISNQRPFFDSLVQSQGREPATGIFTGWNKDIDSVRGFLKGQRYNPHFADQWFELGLPMAYDTAHGLMAMFTGDAPYAFSDQELTDWLSKGLYLDGLALQALNDMGYGMLTGYSAEGHLHADCIEEFTDHPLNGGLQGSLRNGRQSFMKCPCTILQPAAEGAHTLARAVDYGGRVQAACVMGVFENRLGGRVCVSGYYPWNNVLGHTKSEQCKQVIRWLTRDSLPAYVYSLHKANLWVRENPSGLKVLTLLNSSMDAAEDLILHVRTGLDYLLIIDGNMRKVQVAASGADGEYRIFKLPQLKPWSVYLITE